MTDERRTFRAFDLRNASRKEYAGLSEFKNILNHEYYPDDPPIPLEEQVQGWKATPDFTEYEAYATWASSGERILAYCEINISNTGDNEHVADFLVEVLPEYRQQGFGRQALGLLLPFARKHKRTLWLASTSDRIPAAEIFFEHLGARQGLVMQINQLEISDFDKTWLKAGLAQRARLELQFELVFLEGAYPDHIIAEIAVLRERVSNDQPRENLEVEDMKVTPELLRQMEQNIFATGNQRWTMYLIERASGKAVGLTEVFWNPNRPTRLHQGFTGVHPACRNQGLGRWLKAEMLTRVLPEQPEIEFMRTGNANSNAPMLKINLEMGFKPYVTRTVWQVTVEQIEKYVSKEKP